MHEISYYIFALFIMLLCTKPIHSQITDGPLYEGRETDTIGISDNRIDSLPVGVEKQETCLPPCRTGYQCIKGECLSKCNPPCPDHMTCGDDGECNVKDEYSEFKKLKKKIHGITRLEQVQTGEDVIQGFIIKTGFENSNAWIGDTFVTFDKELNILAPVKEYKIYVNASGKNTKYYNIELKIGDVEIVDPILRPARISLGVSWGPIIYKNNFSLALNFDAGLDIASKHYFGVTGSTISLDRKNVSLTNNSDTFYPDSDKVTESEINGFGLTYGYSKKKLLRFITVIPKISIGYWQLENTVSHRLIYNNNESPNYKSVSKVQSQSHENYFFKPGLELGFGFRVVGFRMHIDQFLGESVGPTTINFGLILRIL